MKYYIKDNYVYQYINDYKAELYESTNSEANEYCGTIGRLFLQNDCHLIFKMNNGLCMKTSRVVFAAQNNKMLKIKTVNNTYLFLI